jgi:hypothetical protein
LNNTKQRIFFSIFKIKAQFKENDKFDLLQSKNCYNLIISMITRFFNVFKIRCCKYTADYNTTQPTICELRVLSDEVVVWVRELRVFRDEGNTISGQNSPLFILSDKKKIKDRFGATYLFLITKQSFLIVQNIYFQRCNNLIVKHKPYKFISLCGTILTIRLLLDKY